MLGLCAQPTLAIGIVITAARLVAPRSAPLNPLVTELGVVGSHMRPTWRLKVSERLGVRRGCCRGPVLAKGRDYGGRE